MAGIEVRMNLRAGSVGTGRNIMAHAETFSQDVMQFDAAAEADRIAGALRQQLQAFRRRGAVVALSGGIDSSVVGALCVHALGPKKVYGLSLPELDSSGETPDLSRCIAEHLGIDWSTHNITEMLQAAGCYERRDDAIRSVIPEFAPDWKSKIVLPDVNEGGAYRLYSVVAQSPDGAMHKARLPLNTYLGIVAATNFKQRIRKMLEYYHADRLNYAVMGTPNRLEYDLGFFVKLGDGAADIKPIAHLYKTQVYAMAKHLGLPDEICSRPPTTDTYSLPQSQEEFYFSLPYDKMDLCLYAKDREVAAEDVASSVDLTADQVEWVYRDIDAKRNVAHYLHAPPMTIEEIEAGG